MAFIETQFPTNISYGAVGGPQFSTDITRNFGGYEQRNVNWSEPLHGWNVGHAVKTRAQLDALLAFFYNMQGKANGFRYKDWNDYSVTGQVIGTGDGADTTFQLIKTYTTGANTFTRNIKKPVSSGLVVRVDSVVQAISTDYTVDTTTGIITFTSPPTAGHEIDCDFEFDNAARFDIDKIDISLDHFEIGSWLNIPIIELRL